MVEKSRRRRYCPLCRAPVRTKTGTGHYVCTSGHQFSGYQEEEGEFDATMGSMHERRKRARKRGRESKHFTVFYGTQLDHLILQSIQLVLRKQLYALVHDLGFPSELEQVGFEYWTLYISKLATYRSEQTSATKATQQQAPDRDSEQDSQDEDEGKGDQAHDEHPDAIDKMDEFLQQDLYSSSEEEDDGNGDGDDNDNDDHDEITKEDQEHRRTPSDRTKHRAVKTFGEAVKKLSEFYSDEYKLPRVLPNRPSLIFRFIQQLMLPVEVYPSALQLCSVAADPRRSRGAQFAFDDTLLVMAHVIIIAKLLFGLDGKKRFDGDRQSIINVLPCESDWMQSLDIYDSLQTQTQIPMAFGEFEEFIQVNPDLYSEFCKQELLHESKNEFAQVLNCMEGTDYAQRLSEKQTETKVSPPIETFIRRLYSDVAPPEGDGGQLDDEDWLEPPPLSPGEGFVHYLPDRGGEYLGNYERLLGYACNILGVPMALLEEAVIQVEREVIMQPPLMTRYHRRIRRAKLRARSELDIFQWDKHQFAQQDFTIPDSYDTLQRIDYDKVSREEFIEQFEEKNIPVVIRGVMEGWGACKNWNVETFLKKYYSQPFKVGEDDDGNNVYVKMKYFLKYAQSDGLKDDSPLYIFDSGFVKRKLTPIQKRRISGSSSSSSSSSEKRSKNSPSKNTSSSSGGEGAVAGIKRARSRSNSPTSSSKKVIRVFGKRDSGSASNSRATSVDGDSSKETTSKREEEHASTLLNDFTVPKYFKDDLFQLAGDRRRPPYRWFVVGGARSGTGIHIDPLGTSAWNTLTAGHKRWCLFPPGIPKNIYDPPMKPFDREAVSWFHHVYPRFAANDFELGKKYGMIQVIQRPGETMFVPGGWPHIVMNLDFTIAITQNFCSPTNFETVWLNTRHARPKLAKKFRSQLERQYNKSKKCFYKDLLDKCRSLAYVPMLRMSTDDSTSSSSSSSDSSDGDVSSTESESDIGEICMCHKCKKKRRKETRRENKERRE
ncbi:jumonji domain-containing protein 6 [Mortierella alpina]|nr:jumonji domain-containing protein 6 [Mortierella alpina]